MWLREGAFLVGEEHQQGPGAREVVGEEHQQGVRFGFQEFGARTSRVQS